MTNFLFRDSFCNAHNRNSSIASFSCSVKLYDFDDDARAWWLSVQFMSNTSLKMMTKNKGLTRFTAILKIPGLCVTYVAALICRLFELFLEQLVNKTR